MDPNDDAYLGRAAYEGYRERSRGVSLISGEPLPSWDDLSDEVRGAWCAAADEVQKSLRDSWESDVFKVDE